MSSKNNTTATKEEVIKPALVPKLRFAEFREAWEAKRIETLGYFTGGGTPSKEDASYWSGDIPWISSSDLTEDSISKINVTRFITKQAVQESATKLVPAKSILLISRVGVGKLAVSTFPLCTSQDFTNFTPAAADPLFLAYLLKSQKEILLSFNQGTSIKGFTKDNIANLELGFPSPAEQQKIAECLSSVDELLAAQARKVDALKTHKKGLMQQLFPREGETQPRLRFPEFQNAGEWARMSIQEMIDQQLIVGHLDGNHGELYPKAEEFSQNNEGIPYITANDFINGSVEFSRCKRLPMERARLFKKGVAKDGDILFAHNATVGPVAKLNTLEQFVVLSTTATYFRCNTKHLSNDFLKSALSSPDFVAQYSRVMSQSTRNQVPITTQRTLALHVPKPPEQLHIAECLSSLDALIIAEAQKLEALKTHKKGLMQQLFPSPAEGEA